MGEKKQKNMGPKSPKNTDETSKFFVAETVGKLCALFDFYDLRKNTKKSEIHHENDQPWKWSNLSNPSWIWFAEVV